MNTALLQKLINAQGISGKEMKGRGIISSEIKKYVDNVRVDKVGNLIAHKKGKGPTMMFVAHMDEVGLIVSRIEDDTYGRSEDGKTYFHPIGGVEPFTLIGQKVAIEDKVMGVITTREMEAFGKMMHAIEAPGALDVKHKELMAISLSIAHHCKWCIAYHVKMALKSGATKKEIMEASWMAVLMGGGPALMYMQLVEEALKEFKE